MIFEGKKNVKNKLFNEIYLFLFLFYFNSKFKRNNVLIKYVYIN